MMAMRMFAVGGGRVVSAGAERGRRLDGDGREVFGCTQVGTERGTHVERVEEGHGVELACEWRGWASSACQRTEGGTRKDDGTAIWGEGRVGDDCAPCMEMSAT